MVKEMGVESVEEATTPAVASDLKHQFELKKLPHVLWSVWMFGAAVC